jgi:hypothetical protein
VLVLIIKEEFISIRTYLAKNLYIVAISFLTLLRDRFLLRYNVYIMSLNGSQIGSTIYTSINGIDIAESFRDNN